MLNQLLYVPTTNLSITSFLLCTVASLILGVIAALIHMYKNSYSKNFILTLVILPAIVQTVIMLVNGNIGTGIAVMGAFGLVRFRSTPGNSREITSIFLAMAIGLATGTGYIGAAALLLICVGLIIFLLITLPFGETKDSTRELKISVPENLDYEGLFEDLLLQYADNHKLLKVKTSNMGSLFELHYRLSLKKNVSTKKLMDDIRCRNGNLPVALHYISIPEREEL